MITDNKNIVILSGTPGTGKTTYLSAISRSRFLVDQGGFTFKTENFAKNYDSIKFLNKNLGTYIGTQRPHNYDIKIHVKGIANALCRRFCDLSIIDFNGGYFDGMFERDFDPEEFQDAKEALTDSRYSRKGIIEFFSLKQFDECPNYLHGSCTPQKCEQCRNRTGAPFARNQNRYYVKRKLSSVIKLARATDSPLSIAITNCDVPNYKEKIAAVREILDGFIDDENLSFNERPYYYFVDSLSAVKVKKPKSIWNKNISYPLLDVMLGLLNKSSVRDQSAFASFAFGNNNKLLNEATSKIAAILEKGRFEGLV